MIFAPVADIIAKVFGDVPKWLKGADSKSARRRKACGGSNPSISANKKRRLMAVFFIGKDEKPGFEPIFMQRSDGALPVPGWTGTAPCLSA